MLGKYLSWINNRLDFLVIGTQKAGTTALDHYLRQDPGIILPSKKELQFFNHFKPLFITKTLSYYHSFFPKWKPGLTYGEITPIYLYDPECPNRIFEYNPGIKLIAILRNPIDRAFAQWNMEKNRGNEELDFSQAIRMEKKRMASSSYSRRYHSYVDRGFYAKQLQRYLQLFDRNQLLLIEYQSFKDRPDQSLLEIFDFLNMDHAPPQVEHTTVHKTKYTSKMNDEDRKFLSDLYQSDIQELKDMTGWSLNHWV